MSRAEAKIIDKEYAAAKRRFKLTSTGKTRATSVHPRHVVGRITGGERDFFLELMAEKPNTAWTIHRLRIASGYMHTTRVLELVLKLEAKGYVNEVH